ncbi:MAG TPA: AraC family transcriptional regulator [Chitinophagaceae bacterium]|nr:AraC family transcriptional regulator [Chitinophagaceae bacterium]
MKPLLKKVTPDPQHSFSFRSDSGERLISNWHYHPELELVLIIQGSGTRMVGDHMENFQDGEVVLLGANLPHHWRHDDKFIRFPEQTGAKALVIHFNDFFLGGEFLNLPELHDIKTLFDTAKLGLKIRGKTKKTVAALMEEMQNAPASSQLISLLSILDQISRSKEYMLLSSKGFSFHPPAQGDSDKINAVYEFTFNHYHRKINIQELATLTHLSRQSFCRYFKKKTRKTYFQFLAEVRIGQACRILIENEKSVAEICYACGYNNPSNFNQQFKMITRKTPVQYKKDYLTNN